MLASELAVNEVDGIKLVKHNKQNELDYVGLLTAKSWKSCCLQ